MGARAPSVAAVLGILLGSAVPVSPARAHGATESPPSRATGCEPGRGAVRASAACRAAARVSGAALAEWDELRVPNVRGRDRRMIPDGRLCSAGIERFRGLDLARADWPATRLAAAARHTFRYRVSIPHRGGFRLYVTRDGYRPTRPLTWSDLEPEPFLKATDPPRRDGAYVFAGRLPRGKTGRHVIYTIWQTSDTPDTYYSCSDVTFTAARGRPAGHDPASARAAPSRSAGAEASSSPSAPPGAGAPSSPVAGTSAAKPARSTGLIVAAAGFAGLVTILLVGGAVALVRRTRVRREF
ncbi:lytic polysaccharide monooxygenase auxiliary activity family 9 protein [Actinomadura meyerae]|uniref:lytic polysaccharide monooxygenase auxiliary activity family 9 protein n=1 Tax=Actinomadura meyerae TaxID=240840 RepID=UPI000B78C059|nr:lytic polysaccharide monooxygenase [Actinomadura meyerae]